MRLKQVLINLLTNALKFTPEGGSVSLRACKLDAEAAISITDTGIGIRKEDHEMIFDAFSQSGDNYTSKREGTGLGLALSRRLVDLHGGHLKVESEPGRGSTFTFTLPIRGIASHGDGGG